MTGTVTVVIQTAMENVDSSYKDYVEILTNITGTEEYYGYLAGASNAGSNATPGFARYLRVKVEFNASTDSVSMGIKALLKP